MKKYKKNFYARLLFFFFFKAANESGNLKSFFLFD